MLPLVAVLVLGVFAQQTFADEPAIVGGTTAAAGELPYQCSLRLNGNHVCGCSIISSTCVLTASHCLVGVTPPPYTRMKVVTGILTSRGGVERAVRFAKVHPNYVGTPQQSWKFDVAVLVLEEPIQFNSYQSPVRLATQRPAFGTRCVVSGWGKTNVSSPISPILLKAYTAIVDNKSCQNSHRGQPILDVHLCAYAGHGTGACQGDSGGPLVCNGEQSGIVSWVMPCATGYPDVFCNVAVVRSFIQSVCPSV